MNIKKILLTGTIVLGGFLTQVNNVYASEFVNQDKNILSFNQSVLATNSEAVTMIKGKQFAQQPLTKLFMYEQYKKEEEEAIAEADAQKKAVDEAQKKWEKIKEEEKSFKKDKDGNVTLENGTLLERDLLSMNYSKDVKITPEYIVIHDTANEDEGANVAMHERYWSRPVGTSAHYIVDDGRAVQLLENNWRGWHTGVLFTKHPKMPQVRNSNSIGIEICVNKDGNFDKSFKNAVALTKYLMVELNIDANHVVTHDDATGKGCPHKMLEENPQYWKTFKEEISKVKLS